RSDLFGSPARGLGLADYRAPRPRAAPTQGQVRRRLGLHRRRSGHRAGAREHSLKAKEPKVMPDQPSQSAEPRAADLIYDWNARNRRGPLSPLVDRKVSFFDETLRDGIQSPSVRDPSLEEKQEILRLTAALGIDAVDLGLPGAGARAVADVTALIDFAEHERLGVEYACAARTHEKDINAVADIADATGQRIWVYAFLGSSPIRLYTENWDVSILLERTKSAAQLCRE